MELKEIHGVAFTFCIHTRSIRFFETTFIELYFHVFVHRVDVRQHTEGSFLLDVVVRNCAPVSEPSYLQA